MREDFVYRFLFVLFVLVALSSFAFSNASAPATTPAQNSELTNEEWGKIAGIATGGLGGGVLGSYLFNSLSDSSAPSSVNLGSSALISSMGTISGLLGGIFGGPGGGLIGGAAGSIGGMLFAPLVDMGKTIKIVEKTVSINEKYVKLPEDDTDKILFKSLFKDGSGADEIHTLVDENYMVSKAYVRSSSGTKYQYIPISFYTKDSFEIETGILNLDSSKLDINKLKTEAQEDGFSRRKISFVDSQQQSQVSKRDNEVKTGLESILSSKPELVYEKEKYPFILLFTNIARQDMAFNIPNISCLRYDGVTGITGVDAKPKVLFSWSYSDLKDPEDNYLDATQFNLHLLEKLNAANGLLESVDVPKNAQEFTRPFELRYFVGQDSPVVFSEGKISMTKTTLSIFPSQNRNSVEVSGKITYINAETQDRTIALEQTLATISAVTPIPNIKSISELNLPLSTYVIEAEIDFNGQKYTYSSTPVDFRQSEVLNNSQKLISVIDNSENLRKNLEFEINLMADGYTNDFLKDFRHDAEFGAFLNLTQIQKEIVKSLYPNNIKFLPKAGQTGNLGYVLNNAGKYNVEVVINYKDPSVEKYNIYDSEGKLNTNVESINVYLQIAQRSTNPLYYMPLNGSVGVEQGQISRDGYGVDFRGDMVNFSTINQVNNTFTISPSLVSNSNPLVSIVTRKEESNMEIFNNTKKGVVLEVVNAGVLGGALLREVNFYPSKPYPVAMEWTKNTQDDAFATYQVYSGSGPVNTGRRFLYWSQFCNTGGNPSDFNNYDCEFFNGQKPIDYQGYSDTLASDLKAPTGNFSALTYGLEVMQNSIIRGVNKVYLRSVVYAPANNNSNNNLKISALSSSDEVKFKGINNNNWNTNYEKEASLNHIGPASINSIKEVYDLVGSGHLCISGMNNDSSLSFWWNPEKIFSP